MPGHLALVPIEMRDGFPEDQAGIAGQIREYIGRHARCLTGLTIETPDAAEVGSGSMGEMVARLGVEALLFGTLQSQGETTQLELKIIDREGHDRWHSRIVHPSEELSTLPVRAARAIVSILNPTPGLRPRASQPDQDDGSEAWKHYRQGRFHYASGDGLPGLHRAVVAFEQAIDLQPDLAPAHAGLGEALMILRTAGLAEPDSTARRIEQAAREAFRHDPLHEDAHMLMAQVCMILEHDWCAAREHLLSALDFGPDSAWVHTRYATYLAWRRQFEAALDSIRRAHGLDPFSMRIAADVARIHHYAGQTGVALSILESATSRKLEFATGWMLMCWFHIGVRDADRALAALENIRPQLESTAIWDVFTGAAHGVAGRAEAACNALGLLRARRAKGESIPPQFEATITLALGDFETTTDLVRQAAEQGYGELPMIEADPFWAPLRAWPGYEPIRLEYFGKRLIDN
jgi:tetratricopeptide (TPR) repeat protein